MSNTMYPKGKEKLLTGGVFAVLTDTLKVVPLSSAYAPNLATDEFYDDISAFALAAPATLTGKSVTNGVFDADDKTFTAIPSGDTATYAAIFKDTADPATSPLLYIADTITGFPFPTNGGNLQIIWDNGANKIFAL
jgi:hypothetical protein